MARRRGEGRYPDGWAEFARELKERAGWACIRCCHPHDPASGYTLTVHHLTMDKAEPFENWWAFLVLCQRCHLSIQGRVELRRPWVFEHTHWFRPYVAGYYAKRYLGLDLTRAEVESRLDELLTLEARVVLDRDPLPLGVP